MVAGLDLRVAELALVTGFHFAAQALRHELHAVADAHDRDAQFEQGRVGLVVGLVTELGPPDRMMAFGAKARISSMGMSNGCSSQ